jgi:hypothetical protein
MNFKVATSDMPLRCAHFSRQAATEIENAVTANDFVFLPSLRVNRFRDQWGEVDEEADKEVDEAAVQEAITFISGLGKRGAKVILEAPLPVFRSPPFRCSDWYNRNNPVCELGFVVSRQDEEARRAYIVEIEHRIATSAANVSIWDPLPILCDAQECSAYKAEMPLFFDGDHLSGAGNLLLYDSFRQHVNEYSRAAAATGKDSREK